MDTTVSPWAAVVVVSGAVGMLGGFSFVRAWSKSRREDGSDAMS
jgi:hypothetical protein